MQANLKASIRWKILRRRNDENLVVTFPMYVLWGSTAPAQGQIGELGRRRSTGPWFTMWTLNKAVPLPGMGSRCHKATRCLGQRWWSADGVNSGSWPAPATPPLPPPLLLLLLVQICCHSDAASLHAGQGGSNWSPMYIWVCASALVTGQPPVVAPPSWILGMPAFATHWNSMPLFDTL